MLEQGLQVGGTSWLGWGHITVSQAQDFLEGKAVALGLGDAESVLEDVPWGVFSCLWAGSPMGLSLSIP